MERLQTSFMKNSKETTETIIEAVLVNVDVVVELEEEVEESTKNFAACPVHAAFVVILANLSNFAALVS